jgi:molecular chaperone DnaJ
MSRDAYTVLGVARDVGQADLRAAYRALVKLEHPDKRGGTEAAHTRFLEIQAAYEILADNKRRTAHDLNPTATLETELWHKRRQGQLRRRKSRLQKLYTSRH